MHTQVTKWDQRRNQSRKNCTVLHSLEWQDPPCKQCHTLRRQGPIMGQCRAPAEKGPTSGELILCDHSLEMLNNFILEFVFCK